MDPFSIVTGTAGLLVFTVQTVRALQSQIEGIRKAPSELKDVAQSLSNLMETLSNLQKALDSGDINGAEEKAFVDRIRSCLETVEAMRRFVKPYVNRKEGSTFAILRDIRWSFKRDDLQPYQQRLQQNQQVLHLELQVLTLSAINSGHGHVRADIAQLDARLKARENDKVELASRYPSPPSIFNGTDAGLPIRRYLDTLPTPDHIWTADDSQSDIAVPESYLGDDTVEVNSSTLDGRLRSNSSSSQIPPHSSSQARKVTENTNVIEEEPSPAYLRTMIQKNFGPDYRDVTLEEPLRPDAVQQLVSRLQQTSGYRQEPGIGVLLTATLHSSLDPDVQRTILDMLRILLSPEWRGSILNHIMHQDYVDQDLVCYSVSCLIKGGASPDELDEKGFSPLHRAVWWGNYDLAELLLENGADVNLQTPRSGGGPEDPDCGLNTPLHLACLDFQMMKLILEHGADPNITDDGGAAAIQSLGRYEPNLAQLLLDYGADVHHGRDSKPLLGLQIIHWAALWGNVPLMRLLLERDADINARTKLLETPLLVAAVCGKVEMVEFLIQDPRCDLWGTNVAGVTPEQCARLLGYLEVADMLAKAMGRRRPSSTTTNGKVQGTER